MKTIIIATYISRNFRDTLPTSNYFEIRHVSIFLINRLPIFFSSSNRRDNKDKKGWSTLYWLIKSKEKLYLFFKIIIIIIINIIFIKFNVTAMRSLSSSHVYYKNSKKKKRKVEATKSQTPNPRIPSRLKDGPVTAWPVTAQVEVGFNECVHDVGRLSFMNPTTLSPRPFNLTYTIPIGLEKTHALRFKFFGLTFPTIFPSLESRNLVWCGWLSNNSRLIIFWIMRLLRFWLL